MTYYTIQLKRGDAAVWEKKNLLLEEGEPGFELDTGRLKIGDGIRKWNDLPYTTDDDKNGTIIQGYLSGDKFYKDPTFQELIKGSIEHLYFDIPSKNFYSFNGINYSSITNPNIELATSEKAGITKIYDTVGNNVDGTMTQAAISDELDDKIEMMVVPETETLVLKHDIV